jgi:hypothetical protein
MTDGIYSTDMWNELFIASTAWKRERVFIKYGWRIARGTFVEATK